MKTNKVICAGSIVISQSHGLVISAVENFREVMSVRKSYARICENEMTVMNT
jgi:ABC-type protease/lipase transport system fused ATPase/permease subunit